MSIEKVYKCDLCGEYIHRDAVRRLNVRTLADRPDAGDTFEVGPCCHSRPLGDLLIHAARVREEIEHGAPAPV